MIQDYTVIVDCGPRPRERVSEMARNVRAHSVGSVVSECDVTLLVSCTGTW